MTMARPRAISILAMLGLLSAAVAVLRRGLRRRHERVDLYFDDGSMVSLEEGPQAERLLEIARAAL
jgi:nucleotide-binding universal stress UspA family protein